MAVFSAWYRLLIFVLAWSATQYYFDGYAWALRKCSYAPLSFNPFATHRVVSVFRCFYCAPHFPSSSKQITLSTFASSFFSFAPLAPCVCVSLSHTRAHPLSRGIGGRWAPACGGSAAAFTPTPSARSFARAADSLRILSHLSHLSHFCLFVFFCLCFSCFPQRSKTINISSCVPAFQSGFPQLFLDPMEHLPALTLITPQTLLHSPPHTCSPYPLTLQLSLILTHITHTSHSIRAATIAVCTSRDARTARASSR